MAKKADFTLEEWQQILSLPQVASLYLVLASPSNPLGLAQEMIASAKGIAEALKASSGNELIDAVGQLMGDLVANGGSELVRIHRRKLQAAVQHHRAR